MIRSAEYDICCSMLGEEAAGATAAEDCPRRVGPLLFLGLFEAALPSCCTVEERGRAAAESDMLACVAVLAVLRAAVGDM
jgi:hypothetical protein